MASLEESGHDFRVKLRGRISRRENAGVMALTDVEINGNAAMRQKKGGAEWLPDHQAPTDAKQRVLRASSTHSLTR